MAIANYEDRFVIPTAHREIDEDAFDIRGSCGFSFGNGCSGGDTEPNLFGTPEARQEPDGGRVMAKTFKACRRCWAIRASNCSRLPAKSRAAIEDGSAGAGGRAPSARRAARPTSRPAIIYDLQERYVLLFDRTRSLSLHLFEHVHGESRDRGQAMVDLLAHVRGAWARAVKNELPDFLPLFLEFLATLPQAEACDMLGQPAHILAAIAERLRKRRIALRGGVPRADRAVSVKPKGEEVSALLALPDPDPLDLAALDAAWEEEPVNFGPGASEAARTG